VMQTEYLALRTSNTRRLRESACYVELMNGAAEGTYIAFLILAQGCSRRYARVCSGTHVSRFRDLAASGAFCSDIAYSAIQVQSLAGNGGDWRFWAVMLATFTIYNDKPFPIKDLQITCVHSTKSGHRPQHPPDLRALGRAWVRCLCQR
jgi:hypothetical protein